MAKVRIESIIEYLDYDMKRALERAVANVYPNVDIDRTELYRQFRRAVGVKCANWVDVPDRDVEKKCKNCGERT